MSIMPMMRAVLATPSFLCGPTAWTSTIQLQFRNIVRGPDFKVVWESGLRVRKLVGLGSCVVRLPGVEDSWEVETVTA